MDIPVISIVGHSGSGKTTLLERLIPELRRRGYRVAVVKHHPTPGLVLDTLGKDTWRLAQAGATHVVLAAPDQIVHHHRPEREPPLAEIVSAIRDVDLILVEGYKRENLPKIEIRRGPAPAEQDPGSLPGPGELLALVSEQRFASSTPQFDPQDVGGLADLIETHYL
jgi:molybdopterin-guanine dinucleotide biosynthesis protein B